MMLANALRKSILEAAIAGELTEQKESDGDARELLASIRKEKARLVRAGKLKKERALPAIDENDVPFEIPGNWCWARVGDICSHIQYGTAKKSLKIGKFPVLRMGNLQNGKIDYSTLVYTDDDDDIQKYQLEKNDLLFNRTNSSELVGKVAIYKGEHPAIYAGYLVRLRTLYVNSDYLNYVLQSSYYKNFCYFVQTRGVSQCNINAEKLRSFAIPLPPLKEQVAIVEKIYTLFHELANLEADEHELDALESSFPSQMKSSLLLAAMRGELTQREAGDGDARDLLKEIEREKKRLVKEKKIKKEKPLPPVEEDDVPFEIPNNWCWCRLGDIAQWSAGATPDRTTSRYYLNGTVPWLKTGDLMDGFIENVPEAITEDAVRETSVKLQPPGTVLIAMYGATIGRLGITQFPLTTNQACCGAIPYSGILNLYLFYFLMQHKADFIKQAAGGAQPNISRTKIIQTPFPLPPLPEQRRIARRLEELLPLCEM